MKRMVGSAVAVVVAASFAVAAEARPPPAGRPMAIGITAAPMSRSRNG